MSGQAARDKEKAFQKRLKNWEEREKRKKHLLDKYQQIKKSEENRRHLDAKRRSEFFAYYDDTKDDKKFYSGLTLIHRLENRLDEAKADLKDRLEENEELKELKDKIFNAGYDNPNEEYKKALQAYEKFYAPKILIDNTKAREHFCKHKRQNNVTDLKNFKNGTTENFETSPKYKYSSVNKTNATVPTLHSNNSNLKELHKQKDELLDYELDRCLIDEIFINSRIRPWINKKIIEYIGEKDAILADFICCKILCGYTPQLIIKDLEMIFDDEAKPFVIRLWRLLIHELDLQKTTH